MFICRIDDVSVYGCPIQAGGGNRRAGELAAEDALIAGMVDAGLLPEGAKLAHAASGAPYIEGSAVSLSVTHCREMALIALCASGRRIGIDAESASRAGQLSRVASKFLSPGQLDCWSATSARLLRGWTIKEAVYKSAGIPGLPLNDIPLPTPADVEQPGCYGSVFLRAGDMAIELHAVDVAGFDGMVTLAVAAV